MVSVLFTFLEVLDTSNCDSMPFFNSLKTNGFFKYPLIPQALPFS